MDFTGIKTFLKVAELHSFSRAAALLGYSQPTVSTQIGKLEQELGHPLFERMGHRIMLTEKGQTFLQYAQQVLLLTEQMQENFSGTQQTKGTLKIAMADSLCSSFFPPYLLAYRKLYPDVSVYLYTGTTETLFQYLNHNEADLLYTLDNRSFRQDFIVQEEQQEQIFFCSSASHPLALRLREHPEFPLSWEDIRQYPLYLTEANVSYRYNLERFLGDIGEELHPSVELGNVQALLHLTEQSDGISFLPEFVIRDSLERQTLAILPVRGIDIRVWRQLICRKGKYLTPAMKGMMELLRSASSSCALHTGMPPVSLLSPLPSEKNMIYYKE